MGAYRWLLRLLPRTHRERFEHDMTQVFADEQRAAARTSGALGVSVLWMRELIGLVRFSVRERLGRQLALRGSGGRFTTELGWAWRGVRARGWRAVFIVLLLAVTIAANTVVFSAADAFVFNRAPYNDSTRLAVIERHDRGVASDYIGIEFVQPWREQRDLFAGVEAHHFGAWAYITSNGVTENVTGELVTPGLFQLLGVMPAAGRPFRADDNEKTAPGVVIIAETLARRLFGSVNAAIGQTVTVGKDPRTVLGVMPAGFRFPSAREQFWVPFDPSMWPKYQSVRNVTRVVPDRPFTALQQAVGDRTALVAKTTSYPAETGLTLETLTEARHDTSATVIFGMLAGAAACLLLIACANIASLELATASRRARNVAVHTALGASRGSLMRAGLLEGALMLAASALLGAALSTWASGILADNLTTAMRNVLLNPIDLDTRAIVFMTAIAGLAWLLTTWPSVRRAWRINVMDGLRDDPRVMPGSHAGSRVRQFLMAGQVALMVLLLVGALLYLKAYAARIGQDKGFDTQGLAYIDIDPAPDAPLKGADLEAQVMQRLRAMSGVTSISRTSSVPPYTEGGVIGKIKFASRAEADERIKIGTHGVDPEFFTTMGISIVQGSNFSEGPAVGEIVVDERFAKHFFPGGDALGQRFNMGAIRISGASEFRIVGVARPWRMDQARTASGEDVYVGYLKLSPAAALAYVVRVDDEHRLPGMLDIVRAAAPRSVARVLTLSSLYARLDADTRLAASITSGFGALALVVATAGIYAVMAFLVAGRRREIGIRMALGADRRDVSRLVFGSSLRFVLAGAACGLGAALVASRWISGQLFGVTGTDPTTYAAVTVLVVFTAMAATWAPARTAALVDPAKTLRGD